MEPSSISARFFLAKEVYLSFESFFEELFMCKIFSTAALVGLLFVLTSASQVKAESSSAGGGNIVIVFKDGHQQSFPLSSILRIDFKDVTGTQSSSGATPARVPGRKRFLGKWQVGEGNGDHFYIELDDNGEAKKSIGAGHGTWVYVNGEARISWDDGWRDVIRKSGIHYQKYAYEPGKSLSDTPSNVTEAMNPNPKPI